jgi:hypothetical protein
VDFHHLLLAGLPAHLHKYLSKVEVWYRGALVASHARQIGERDVRHKLPGHHSVPTRGKAQQPEQERLLLDDEHPAVAGYAAALKQRGRGLQTLHRLLELKRTYPAEPFLAAVEQAWRYGLFDLGRLEALILKFAAGEFFRFPEKGEDDA